MKLNYFLLLILPFALTGCKKDRSTGTQEPASEKILKQVAEEQEGQSLLYDLALDDKGRVLWYNSTDGSFKSSYTYRAGKVNSVRFEENGFSYTINFQYTAEGALTNSSYAVTYQNREPEETLVVVSGSAADLSLSLYNNAYILRIKEGNVLSAEINHWYFKRKLSFTYGSGTGMMFGKNLPIPRGELSNPLVPADLRLSVFLQMVLTVFSRNNILSANSALYERFLLYGKDTSGRVVVCSIGLTKLVDGRPVDMPDKSIIYHYGDKKPSFK